MFKVALLIVAAFLGHFWWSLFSPYELPSPVTIVIPEGATLSEIVATLEERGLIRNPLYVSWYVQGSGRERSLKAGTYTFEGDISSREVINRLAASLAGEELTLRFIEGWTVKDMARYLAGAGVMPENNFLSAAAKEYDLSVLASNPKGASLEGFLFPDTYRVFHDVTPDELVMKMVLTFDTKLTAELRDEISRQNRTIFEVVTLASILEKEVKTPEDKALAADVFLKRLREGIGLQADSTVNYVTGKNVTRASFSDIAVDSPYNTYKYRGLPPGPISNPGLDSLVAAIFPKKNPYFYFLTTDDGTAIFSRTLDEHNAAKAKYLR